MNVETDPSQKRSMVLFVTSHHPNLFLSRFLYTHLVAFHGGAEIENKAGEFNAVDSNYTEDRNTISVVWRLYEFSLILDETSSAAHYAQLLSTLDRVHFSYWMHNVCEIRRGARQV